MGEREEGDGRPDAAAQAEHRVPLDPGAVGRQRLDREADVADAPERQPQREGIPEQALGAFPFAPAPEHDGADAGGEQQQKRVGDQNARDRMAAQRLSEGQVHDDVENPEKQVSQPAYTCSTSIWARCSFPLKSM